MDAPSDQQFRIGLAESLRRLADQTDRRFVELFRHGTLTVELYAPRGIDSQAPHTRDEVYVVVQGSGAFVYADRRQPFSPGDVLFAPAGVEHRFVEFTDDLCVWVFFYGPEGGEDPEQE